MSVQKVKQDRAALAKMQQSGWRYRPQQDCFEVARQHKARQQQREQKEDKHNGISK